jgi:hypothetical protein
MTPYRCCFLGPRGEAVPPGFSIEADNIETAIERALEVIAGAPRQVGFEMRDADRVVHRFVRPQPVF